jgi:hypothetical protein
LPQGPWRALLASRRRPPPFAPQAQLKTLQESLADAERRVFEGELARRKLHNTIQARRGARARAAPRARCSGPRGVCPAVMAGLFLGCPARVPSPYAGVRPSYHQGRLRLAFTLSRPQSRLYAPSPTQPPPQPPAPQELKGNIRVFCRVRPSLQAEVEGEGSGTEPLATSFPTSGAGGKGGPAGGPRAGAHALGLFVRPATAAA